MLCSPLSPRQTCNRSEDEVTIGVPWLNQGSSVVNSFNGSHETSCRLSLTMSASSHSECRACFLGVPLPSILILLLILPEFKWILDLPGYRRPIKTYMQVEHTQRSATICTGTHCTHVARQNLCHFKPCLASIVKRERRGETKDSAEYTLLVAGSPNVNDDGDKIEGYIRRNVGYSATSDERFAWIMFR